MFETLIQPIGLRLTAAGVIRLGVFGSMARNEATAESDVDVPVSFDPARKSYDNLFEVGEALEAVFQRRVDLVTDDSLSRHLGPRILREVGYVDFDH